MNRAKTGAERQKFYEAKIKSNPLKYEEFKQRRAAISKASRRRQKEAMTEEDLKAQKEYERVRKRKQRMAKSTPLKVKLGGYLIFILPFITEF